MMDVTKMVASLHEELSGLKLAIEALELIAAGRGGGKRRGRPPKSESMAGPVVKRRGRPPGSKNKKKTEAAQE